MSKGGRFEKKQQRGSKKIALIVACVIAASVLGIVAFAGSYVNGMLDEVNHVEVSKVETVSLAAKVEPKAEATATAQTVAATEAAEAAVKGEYINYLIVGKPVWEDGKRLTDTMILCTMDTASKTMTMTPLQENALVQVPDYKSHAGCETTLNAVYGLGSKYNGTVGAMELMNQTLYNNFGIEVDYNFEIGFELFVNMVSWVDGVEIELSNEEASYLSQKTGKEIKAGAQTMDAALAKSYVAMWGEEEKAGVTSISAQRKLVEAILKEIKGEYFTSLESIVRKMLPMLTTSMSRDEVKESMLRMLPMLRNLSIEKGDACPAEYQEEQKDLDGDDTEETVLVFDAAQVSKVMRAITEGEQG